MLHSFWEFFLYKPFLNALAVFLNIIPGANLGVAVILLTILVKTILFPLSQKFIEGQVKMKNLEPEIKKIKESGATKEEQAKRTFDLYRENKANPFSGCLIMLIQIPIIFALYYVFYKGISNESFSANLYSFIKIPENVNNYFFWIDITKKSIVFAILAGISQLIQARLMPKQGATNSGNSFQDSFSKSMQLQMQYVFPVLITFFAYSISGAIAIYWTISNIFSIAQQIYAKKKDSNLLTVPAKSTVL